MSSVGTRAFAVAAALLAAQFGLASLALAAPKPKPGTLTQLAGKHGCLVDRSAKAGGCAKARALDGPGPFMGSRAIAVSPDGKHVSVALIPARSLRTATLVG